jgi:ribosomal-protein-alanine N-acetyltransferase
MLKKTINLLDVIIETERLMLVPVSINYKQDVFREFDKETTKYMNPKPAEDISETETLYKLITRKHGKG